MALYTAFYIALIHLFSQGSPDKVDNVAFLESSKAKDFDPISSKIGRSSRACCHRWYGLIAPILKSDILGLRQDVEWQKDVLRYVVEKKFTTHLDIPYNKVVMDVCPGQTTQSLCMFLRNAKQSFREIPFHECCQKQLDNPHPISHLGNEEIAQTKSEYASKILEFKQKLKSN